MKVHESLLEVVEELTRSGWQEVEVFHKRGRSRTVHYSPVGDASSFHQEEGWAVRAGDRQRSFYYAASGQPRPDAAWPEARRRGLRLPSPRPVPRWTPPSTLDAPLLSESDARGLFQAVARELDTELPGARLISGRLDDGSSESQLFSSREVAAATRQRAAALVLEAVGRGAAGSSGRSVSLQVAEREARRLTPTALARRLADRLLIAEQGRAPHRDRGEFLLAPPVAAGLLAALSSLWIGPAAEDQVAALLDGRLRARGQRVALTGSGRLASPSFTLIDDGRLTGGILAAPVDGEGQPTREVVLVEEGHFRQPLLAWHHTAGDPKRASGCNLRPGWRDLPRQSPTHLYLRSDGSTSVVALLTGMQRGYYLLALEGEPRIDAGAHRFAAPVAGFAIDSGKATGAVAGAWLVGSLPALLAGVQATARDLTFQPRGAGMIGAPSVLVRGLELRHRP